MARGELLRRSAISFVGSSLANQISHFEFRGRNAEVDLGQSLLKP